MGEENEQELVAVIGSAVREAIEKELGSYKVHKEQHYQDHIWLKELREWTNSLKSSFWRSLVMALVPGLLMLLILGFITWMSFKTAIGR